MPPKQKGESREGQGEDGVSTITHRAKPVGQNAHRGLRPRGPVFVLFALSGVLLLSCVFPNLFETFFGRVFFVLLCNVLNAIGGTRIERRNRNAN